MKIFCFHVAAPEKPVPRTRLPRDIFVQGPHQSALPRQSALFWHFCAVAAPIGAVLASPPSQICQTLKQACAQGCPKRKVHTDGPIDSRNSAIHNAYRSSPFMVAQAKTSVTECGV